MRTDAMPKLIGALTVALLAAGSASAANYLNPAPIAAYQMASQGDEIAMARSAAPPSIAKDAEVMTLGPAGYRIAVKGKNGFVCMVERAWANEPASSDFWNPEVRGPLCFNPAAVRSVMPTYLERTKWVLAGATKAQIVRRTKAAIAAGKIRPPENGAMSYMMSKIGNLGEPAHGGPWHPHLMYFVPRGPNGSPPDWGADLPGSPVLYGGPGLDPAALYFVPLAKWSDGTMAVMAK